MVISVEEGWDTMSPIAKGALGQLHKICHGVVNKFDPIPRFCCVI